MMVETVVRFNDKKEGCTREIGEVFRCSKERYEEILKVGEFVKPASPATKQADKAVSDE